MSLVHRLLSAIQGETLSIGSRLPTVSQIGHHGFPVDLAAAGSKGFLLVYFYPKAGTPVCTRQACGLRDAFIDLTDAGVRVIGVSSDGPQAQESFRDKFALPFDLLADEDGSVRRAFGVPRLLGITLRQSFLFKDGILIWKDHSASAVRQAADVLNAIAKLS